MAERGAARRVLGDLTNVALNAEVDVKPLEDEHLEQPDQQCSDAHHPDKPLEAEVRLLRTCGRYLLADLLDNLRLRHSSLLQLIEEFSDEEPQHVTEYAADIFELLRKEEELVEQPDYTYMSRQQEINERMRTILIDWLVDVHLRYRLQPLTLFRTVQVIDRYLATTQVPRRRLQLVGVAAISLCSKYEEICPPSAADWVFIANDSFSRSDLDAMECSILMKLSFRLERPTTVQFLDRLLHLANVGEGKSTGSTQVADVSRFLAEMILQKLNFLRYSPSILAATCICLSRSLLGFQNVWPAVLAQISWYKQEQLWPCMLELFQLLKDSRSDRYQASFNKFSRSALDRSVVELVTRAIETQNLHLQVL